MKEAEEEDRLIRNQQEKEARRQAIANQNDQRYSKQVYEANNRKAESQKNNTMIRRQKEAEMMKNASIKEMIRKQKYDANDRKEMVSPLYILCC